MNMTKETKWVLWLFAVLSLGPISWLGNKVGWITDKNETTVTIILIALGLFGIFNMFRVHYK